MALAILQADDGSGGNPGGDDVDGGGQRWFRFDIGSNRYFRFAVGGPERRRLDGIGLIDQPRYISPLQGPLPESAMGRGRFGIDEAHFADGAEFVQMMSYRTRNREGPAVSAIVRAMRPLPQRLAPVAFSAPRQPPVAHGLLYRCTQPDDAACDAWMPQPTPARHDVTRPLETP